MRLTRRQREVVALVAQGYKTGAVARALGIAPRTVRVYLEQVDLRYVTNVVGATTRERVVLWWRLQERNAA